MLVAEPGAYDTTVKLNLTHNISTAKMAEVRFDLMQTIESVKLQIEKRYGSDPQQVQLILKDKQGNVISHMNVDTKFLGQYNPEEGYTIHVVDNNPNSILNGLEDTSQVQKFKISDEEYNKKSDNFRKFKQKLLQNQAAGDVEKKNNEIDDEYLQQEALQIGIGSRCLVLNGQHRGTVKYGRICMNNINDLVGQVPQMGLGFFIGIQLDEPFGTNNGTIKGYAYFQCQMKYGVFLRPNEIEVGDFPEMDLDEI